MSDDAFSLNWQAGKLDPLISIIMSVYNCESTLREAVDSIVTQTYPNWEFIICDDGSTDGTAVLLRQIAESMDDPRIVLLRNETNRKLAYSLNRCLERANGEYIARMDGDDISEPHRLETQLRFLQGNPGLDLVGSSMLRFNAKGAGDVIHPAEESPNKWSMGRSGKAPFFHATILARREVFKKVDNYTVAWRTERGQDHDLWFKFFAAGLDGWNLSEPLYRVREDAAAIRRRTARARFGAYVTSIKGYRALGYPPQAYIRPTVNLMKVLIPYRMFDWHRSRSRRRAASEVVMGSQA